MSDSREPVSIIVPTYKEARNIALLVEGIDEAMRASGTEWELILADDDSRDGSQEIVDTLADTHPVRMIVRTDTPRDLSLSVLAAIDVAAHDRIVVMDADLSHPPSRINDLADALDEGCDMSIGSRYTQGGGFERGWGVLRLVNSLVASSLARPLVACSDPMSGNFAVRRSTLPELSLFRPIGYKIGLELMVRGQLRVREVPITFSDRTLGESKMNLRQQWNYLRHLHRLYMFRFGDPVRIVSFGAVGFGGFLIDFTVYLTLIALGADHRWARFLSFWPAVSWNWVANRVFTFEERPRRPRMRQWAEFTFASIAGLIVNVGGYIALTNYVEFFDQNRIIALIIGVLLGSMVNFLASTLLVYRRHIASDPDP